MKNKWLLLAVFAFALASQLMGSVVQVVEDGQPVTERGIFMPGCVYGDLHSLSDHAPMVWPAYKLGTWNITSRVSHKQIKTKTGTFMGHKFRTNDKGELVDISGKPVIIGHVSEADILSRNTITNHYYALRLERIARKIKQIMTRHKLDYLAIQEIPYKGQKDVNRNDLQRVLADALAPDFSVIFPPAGKYKSGDDKVIDTALVSRARVALTSPVIDQDNRMQSFCNKKEGRCVVSTHLLASLSERDVVSRCEAIVRMVGTLKKRGFDEVLVTGDFNASAERFARSCARVKGFTPVIRTSKTKAQSCSTNKGDPSPNNIDLMMLFEQ